MFWGNTFFTLQNLVPGEPYQSHVNVLFFCCVAAMLCMDVVGHSHPLEPCVHGLNPGPASDNFITCYHYHGVCKTVGFTVLRCLPPTAITGSCSAAWVFGQVRRDKQGLWKTKLRMQVAKTIKEGKHVPKPEMKLWKSKVVPHFMEGRCGAFAAIKGFFCCTRRVVVGSNFWQVCRQHQTIATCRISPLRL